MQNELNLSKQMLPIGPDQMMIDPDYFNWGSSIIKGEDEKYHLFYSRWPKKYNFTAWLTHSEIAHAVADHPAGPYTFVEISLQSNENNGWDDITAHNPKIKRFDGKYYLYYIATSSGDKAISKEELIETAKVGYSHENWPILRNNQRTGVAVSSSINGPWKRSENPIIEPSGPITTLTVNPAICEGRNGEYLMIIKGDKPNETRFIRNQALAKSPFPSGPFTILTKPVIDNLDTEDVSMWFDELSDRFYAIFHTHGFIGLMTSIDGYSWTKAKNYKVNNKRLKMKSSTELIPDRMERPFVFIEDGHPTVISFAIKKGNDAFSVFVPLTQED